MGEAAWSNEELALKIQAGEREYIPLIWERTKHIIYKQAQRYNHVILQYTFLDMDDIVQCGFLAVIAALKAYNPEKGYRFSAYIGRRFQEEVHALCGHKKINRKGEAWLEYPPYAISLNAPAFNDESEDKEIIDTLTDDNTECIIDNVLLNITRETVNTAVNKLPSYQRYVIREIYYNEKTKASIVDGKRYPNYEHVVQAENSALLRLRRDKELKKLHYMNILKPAKPTDIKARPERIIAQSESMAHWVSVIYEEMERMQYGL